MHFLPTLQALVASYQAFEHHSAAHIATLGLTPSQFDVLSTLGNQPPMNYKTLGEKTLITKGTLTGVIERLIIKGLVKKLPNAQDARSQLVTLTQRGESLFNVAFPAHMAYLAQSFNQLSEHDLNQLTSSLHQLHRIFSSTAARER